MSLRSVYIATVAVAIAATIPAVALAGFPGSYANDYEGEIERDATAHLGFDVHRVDGTRVADAFDIANVHFSCETGFGETERTDVAFPEEAGIPVVDKRFKGKVSTLSMVSAIVLKVEGRLLGEGRARGVMSYKTDPSDPPPSCYSGILRWRDSGQ